MRDPNRIESVLAAIRRCWVEQPDLRLGQLLSNCVYDDNLFYLEDDKLIGRLEAYHSRLEEKCVPAKAGAE